MDIIATSQPILQKYQVSRASYFGSYARNEQQASSDIDIVIEAPQSMGIDFLHLRRELSEALGAPVDLTTYRSLDPLISPIVLREQKQIL